MNLSELNDWLNLAASLGVFGGLIFLGLEIQQNTRVVERELMISQSNNVDGQIVESDYLAEILVKISQVQGVLPIAQEYMETYDMTPGQAERWWRYIMQIWEYNQADWIYRGKNPSECNIFFLQFLDHQIFYKHMKPGLDVEYTACLDEALQNGT